MEKFLLSRGASIEVPIDVALSGLQLTLLLMIIAYSLGKASKK